MKINFEGRSPQGESPTSQRGDLPCSNDFSKLSTRDAPERSAGPLITIRTSSRPPLVHECIHERCRRIWRRKNEWPRWRLCAPINSGLAIFRTLRRRRRRREITEIFGDHVKRTSTACPSNFINHSASWNRVISFMTAMTEILADRFAFHFADACIALFYVNVQLLVFELVIDTHDLICRVERHLK